MVTSDAFREPADVDAWEGLDDPDAYQVLAFDPGGTTGWGIFQVHPDALGGDPDIPILENVEWWTAGEFTGDLTDQVDEAVELCNSWPGARLVTEGFKLDRSKPVVSFSPLEVNFALKWALRPRYFVVQSPSLAMSTVTDDRQKDWGLWIPGKPHARDAVKHCVTFLKKKKEQEVRSAVRFR